MPRPATNRAVAEEIARSYEKFDRQELLNILSFLTKTYVVDGTMPFNLVGDKSAPGDAGAEKDLDFPKVIDQLKRRLPHIPELGYFQVEGGRVTLRAGNQKVTFGERVTVEFVPSSNAPPPAPTATSKGAERAIAAASQAAQSQKPAKDERTANLSDSQQEALNDIVTRFKGLELD